MKSFLFIVVFSFFSSIYSQSKKIVVLDSATLVPIPFLNVIKQNSKIGWAGDEKGFVIFDLRKIDLKDTVVFRALGFNNTSIVFSEVYKNDTILLSQTTTKLKTVTIKAARYKRARLGRKKATKNDWTGSGIRRGRSPNYKQAQYIPNEIGANGIIKEIKVFIRFASDYPFEIDILDVNEINGRPTKSLLKKPLKCLAKKDNKWLTIDVRNYNMSIPENGFFVAINWDVDSALNAPEKQYTYKMYHLDTNGVTTPQIDTFFYRATVIGNRYEKETNWWIYTDNGWLNYWGKYASRDSKLRNSSYQHLAVYANILYSKSIKKYEENILDKEGIVSKKDQKKILAEYHPFVPKSEINFPQNNVFELFESIKRALDSNNLDYIAHHLLYYTYDDIQDFKIEMENKKRNEIIFEIEEILKNREKLVLTKTGNGFYEFTFGNKIFGQLLLKNGEWRLAATTERRKVNEE